MNMIDAQELRAYRESLDAETVLGRLWWYSVSETYLPHADVKAGLEAVGLGAITPPYPKDLNVYQRVTSAAERKRVPTNREGIFRNYMVRPVSGDEGVVVRRIVVETRNTAGKRLAYTQVVDLTFDRATSVLGVQWVSDSPKPDPVLDEIIAQVQADYTAQRGMVISYSIREMIRHALLRAGATCVRESGGIYFLPEANVEPLVALEAFAPSVGDALNLHSLPVPDNEKQRGMVRKAFEAESIGAVDAMMTEVRELLTSGNPITDDKYAKLMTNYRTLVDRTKQYGEILEDNLSGTHSRLEIFQAQIVQLLGLVK